MMINLLLFYAVFELVRLLTPSRNCINNGKIAQAKRCIANTEERTENFAFENYVMNSNDVKKVCLAQGEENCGF